MVVWLEKARNNTELHTGIKETDQFDWNCLRELATDRSGCGFKLVEGSKEEMQRNLDRWNWFICYTGDSFMDKLALWLKTWKSPMCRGQRRSWIYQVWHDSCWAVLTRMEDCNRWWGVFLVWWRYLICQFFQEVKMLHLIPRNLLAMSYCTEQEHLWVGLVFVKCVQWTFVSSAECPPAV